MDDAPWWNGYEREQVQAEKELDDDDGVARHLSWTRFEKDAWLKLPKFATVEDKATGKGVGEREREKILEQRVRQIGKKAVYLSHAMLRHTATMEKFIADGSVREDYFETYEDRLGK